MLFRSMAASLRRARRRRLGEGEKREGVWGEALLTAKLSKTNTRTEVEVDEEEEVRNNGGSQRHGGRP